MEARKIRISPSGPFLTNDEGGFAIPGPGFQLRLAETKATCGGNIDDTPAELGSGNLRATLENCSPDLQYKASAQINTWYQSNGSDITLTVALQRSIDAGATWLTVRSDTFQSQGSDSASMAVVNAELSLGGGEAWELVAPANDMIVRAMVSVGGVSDAASMPTFQGFISLAELL
jgi:hypothetical protein